VPDQNKAIGMKTGEPFALAVIRESWRHPVSGEIIRTFCIVRAEANDLLVEIHGLMPDHPARGLRSLARAHRTRSARPSCSLPR